MVAALTAILGLSRPLDKPTLSAFAVEMLVRCNYCLKSGSIHTWLPHDSPHTTAGTPFRPRIHARPIRGPTSSQGPLPSTLNLVARSDLPPLTFSPFLDPSGMLGFLTLASPERVGFSDGKEALYGRADRVRFEAG